MIYLRLLTIVLTLRRTWIALLHVRFFIKKVIHMRKTAELASTPVSFILEKVRGFIVRSKG